MITEEKARAYDKALERARQIKDGKDEWRYSDPAEITPVLTEIFPELAESEDERIRKALYEFISDTLGDEFDGYDFNKNEALAYLEKQKKQKPNFDTHWENGSMVCEQKPAEWSDDDDQLIGFIFDLLNDLVWRKDWAMSKEECLERLKSLRPVKQEWSEEDEKVITEACCVIDKYANSIQTLHHRRSLELFNLCEKLKSLRPSWKPSEEQMEALESAVKLYKDTHFERFHIRIESLYEQLKSIY